MSFDKLHPSVESMKQYLKVKEFNNIKTLYVDLEEIEIPLVEWDKDDLQTQVHIGTELFDMIVHKVCCKMEAENKFIENIERYKRGEEYELGK